MAKKFVAVFNIVSIFLLINYIKPLQSKNKTQFYTTHALKTIHLTYYPKNSMK